MTDQLNSLWYDLSISLSPSLSLSHSLSLRGSCSFSQSLFQSVCFSVSLCQSLSGGFSPSVSLSFSACLSCIQSFSLSVFLTVILSLLSHIHYLSINLSLFLSISRSLLVSSSVKLFLLFILCPCQYLCFSHFLRQCLFQSVYLSSSLVSLFFSVSVFPSVNISYLVTFSCG